MLQTMWCYATQSPARSWYPPPLSMNKNNLIESNTGLETPANFSATNRLDTRNTPYYLDRVETIRDFT